MPERGTTLIKSEANSDLENRSGCINTKLENEQANWERNN